MALEKAYKLLALQEKISNSKAKTLIDKGLVKVANRKILVARHELEDSTIFKIEKIANIEIIYEDEMVIVINKPAFVNSQEIEKIFKQASLLHRLDKETSGVMILTKDEDFRHKAINEFKYDRVYKEYVAWVEGTVIENMDINKPILTVKGKSAKSKIDKKGKPARTELFPILVTRKRSKVKLIIHQGRTHQIRCHLSSVGHFIVGDTLYGGVESSRVMLHSKKIEILGKKFQADEPGIFKKFE